MSRIIDISHHQDPKKMNYDKLAKQVDLVIIRTQYGSRTVDRHYKTHHAEFRKRGVSTAAYAWVRGKNIADMQQEATDFYNRTKDIEPTFWFLDVEEKSMVDMRAGVSAYVKRLRELGAKKVGIYVGHHLYKQFNLNLAEVDAVWIPHYGRNTGQVNSKPAYPCDIHQYTSKGRLDGYNGNLDLNRLMGTKSLEYFIGGGAKPQPKPQPPKPQAKKTWQYYISGSIVKDLQRELNKQFNKGLKVDGYFGDKTIAALINVRQGAKGNITKIIQRRLIALGYSVGRWGVDGSFGPATYAAVVKFQKDRKLKANGIVGPETWKALFRK